MLSRLLILTWCLWFLAFGLLSSCDSDNGANEPEKGDMERELEAPLTVEAIVEADRTGFFFNRPYPSDELLSLEGTLDLSTFPASPLSIGNDLIQGWIRQIGKAVRGFPALPLIVFRFEEVLMVDERYNGEEDDPIRCRSLDSEDRVPLVVRFLADPVGDPFLPSNSLILMPQPSHPLRLGERYIVEIDQRLATAPQNYVLPEQASENSAVATVFTVADHLAEYHSLLNYTDKLITTEPTLLDPDENGLREVVELGYHQGTTPNDKKSTLCTVRFADGAIETTYLDNRDGTPEQVLDLTEGPFNVFQTTIQTAAFQEPEGRPYISPGTGFISDCGRSDGWILFDENNNLTTPPHAEDIRVVIQVPRELNGPHAVVLWLHGSGGDAYEPAARINPEDRLQQLRSVLADLGAVIVSADLPLYGQRYPMIDEGYSKDLGFYNVANLVAYRDNLRQGAIDAHILFRFVRERLPALLGNSRIDVDRIGAFGHSLGSQIQMLAAVAQQGEGPKKVLLSGSGGFISNYLVSANVLVSNSSITDFVFLLANETPPENVTGNAVLGALFGVPSAAWEHVDRFHPLLQLFQTIIDPSDPLSMARLSRTPMTLSMGIGDRQAPNEGSRWLTETLPEGTLIECQPQSDYDGHYCMFREDRGQETLRQFVEGL